MKTGLRSASPLKFFGQIFGDDDLCRSAAPRGPREHQQSKVLARPETQKTELSSFPAVTGTDNSHTGAGIITRR